MANGTRWTREFTNWNTFLNELGEIGIHVGPRLGASAVTQGQMEDYVLRPCTESHASSRKAPVSSDRVRKQPNTWNTRLYTPLR